jgi:hypothetical protein
VCIHESRGSAISSFVDLESRPKLGRKEKGGRVEDAECAVVVFRAIIRAR